MYNILRWSARGLSVLLLGFFGLFILAHVAKDGVDFSRFTGEELVMTAALFAMLIGLIVAWFKELPGGLLTLAGYVLFAAIDGFGVIGTPFTALVLVALLFLSAWLAGRRRSKPHPQPQ